MRIGIIVAVGIVASVGVAFGAYLIFRSEDYVPVNPPIAATATGTADPALTIPEGFLEREAAAKVPLDQPEVRWERSDEPGMPPLLNPCGSPSAEVGRVAGRQMALVTPTLYKVERLMIYRTETAAEQAMVGYRDALSRCASQPSADGTTTKWRWESLDIGDEAMFVAGQRYEGNDGTHGHHRGVLMRQGRTVLMYVDFGQATDMADRSEVVNYEKDARRMADKISAASWT